jgi:hypothetical protein
MKSVPGGFSSRSPEAAPEVKKKSAKGERRMEVETMAPAPAGSAVIDSAGKYVPQLMLRVTVSDSSAAARTFDQLLRVPVRRLLRKPVPMLTGLNYASRF